MRSKILKLLMILLSIIAILSFSGCGKKSDGKNGERSPDSLLMTVPDDVSPVAVAGADQTVVQGDPVTLDGSESFDEDGEIVSYQWELLDGTSLGEGAILSTNLSIPVGTYEIVLIVTDDKGATGVDTAVITVVAPPKPPATKPPATKPPATKPPVTDNEPPVADAGEDQNIEFPVDDIETTVQLDGSGSQDDGRIEPLDYKWTPANEPAGSRVLSDDESINPTFEVSCNDNLSDIGCFGDIAVSKASSRAVQTVNPLICDYVFTLTVDDGEFTDDDNITISVDYSSCPT